jgi:hypothetical protein
MNRAERERMKFIAKFFGVSAISLVVVTVLSIGIGIGCCQPKVRLASRTVTDAEPKTTVMSEPVCEPYIPLIIADGVLMRDDHLQVEVGQTVNFQGYMLYISEFSDCLSGPGQSGSTECDYSDINGDGSVDLLDFCQYQLRYGRSTP